MNWDWDCIGAAFGHALVSEERCAFVCGHTAVTLMHCHQAHPSQLLAYGLALDMSGWRNLMGMHI